MSTNGISENGASQTAAISSTTSRSGRSSSQSRTDLIKAAASSTQTKIESKSPIVSLFSSLRSTSSTNNSMINGTNNSARSPVSPSRITRIQEKEEMQNLNDRLAIYIDAVRRLETENSRLQGIVHSYSENSTRDVSEIKQLYEKELDDTKKLIDELAKDKARFEIEVNKHRASAQEAISKYERRDKEFKQIESKLKKTESECVEYKTRCEVAQNEATRYLTELTQLRPHATELEKQLNKLKKQLEDETLLRVDLENKNTSLKEDLHFKSQIYDKETDQLRSSKRIEIEQVDNRLKDEYDYKLVAELQRIRDETDYKIREMKEEVERRYQNKFADTEASAKRALSQNNSLREEVSNYRSKLEESQTDFNNLQNKLANNETRIKDLEDKLRKANAKYDSDMADKDAETESARKELSVLLLDYQELYDIKIALDMEITAYRKLLESEEQRLNISTTMAASNLHNSYLNESSLIGNNTTNGAKNKKRRLATDEEQSQAIVETPLVSYTQSFDSKLGFLIGEHDFEANCITITNQTEKDVPIGHWVIRRSADAAASDFKFPKNAVIKSGSKITVWSNSAANGKNEPPSDFLSKQAWTVGDKMITILEDKEGNEQARRESEKEVRAQISIEKRQRTSTISTLEVHTTSGNGEPAPQSQTAAKSRFFGIW